ncbi:hypothetical protein PAPYR_8978 [Paratrimastix pyriformis]|uniref:Secreted protein n=1 Tax=Paratrimastix pyriformis TaxID=342808 RepID=A0ABQ8UDL1_9EUKA|nr:hypothetical protein PAPYR_8978 [Paratrimastix pyriformis]
MIKKTLLLLAFRSFSTPCVQRDSSHAKLRRTKKCSAEVLFRLRSYFPENTVYSSYVVVVGSTPTAGV